MKLNLKNITAITIDCTHIEQSIKAADICNYYADFNDIKILTHLDIISKYNIVKIKPILSFIDYNIFFLKEINNYFETSHALMFQQDGFILNPDAWTEDFLEYDYIGATWEFQTRFVGNGGFSLRSKKLCKLLAEDNNIIADGSNEDAVICQKYRNYLLDLGIKIAPPNIGDKFSKECLMWNNQFGFHGLNVTNISMWKDKNKFGF